jgi:hypothetical protein
MDVSAFLDKKGNELLKKSDIRAFFRNEVYKRDKFKCAICGLKPSGNDWQKNYHPLDAHHITDRSYMPFGGYVVQNGISLCHKCHLLAETYHATGKAYPGCSPNDLYEVIGSSYDWAVQNSYFLCGDEAKAVQEFGRLQNVIRIEFRIIRELNDKTNFPSLGDTLIKDETSWNLACEEIGINVMLEKSFLLKNPGAISPNGRLVLYGLGRCH